MVCQRLNDPRHNPVQTRPQLLPTMKRRVLMLCTGSSCRSHIADAILRAAGELLEVQSAGFRPISYVHPPTVRLMHEIGLDISHHRSKHLNEFLNRPVETVITVCSDADAACPAFPGQVIRHHWPFDDPVKATGTVARNAMCSAASRTTSGACSRLTPRAHPTSTPPGAPPHQPPPNKEPTARDSHLYPQAPLRQRVPSRPCIPPPAHPYLEAAETHRALPVPPRLAAPPPRTIPSAAMPKQVNHLREVPHPRLHRPRTQVQRFHLMNDLTLPPPELAVLPARQHELRWRSQHQRVLATTIHGTVHTAAPTPLFT